MSTETAPTHWATERIEMATKVMDAENQAVAAELAEQTRRTYAELFTKWCNGWVDFPKVTNWADLFDQFDKALIEGWRP